MEERIQILNKINLLKEDSSSICRLEISKQRYNDTQTDIIIGHFERVVKRNHFFVVENTEDHMTFEEKTRKRKIANIFNLFEASEWSDPVLLKLIDIIFIRIFTSTKALIQFSRNMKELRKLSKTLYYLESKQVK